MSSALPLSSAQEAMLCASLSRYGYNYSTPRPDDETSALNLLDILSQSQLLRSGKELLSQLNYPQLPSDTTTHHSARDRILAALGRSDMLSRGRAAAISHFLRSLEQSPNILGEEKKLRNVVHEMNQLHEEHLTRSFACLDQAFERFNDNVALGRPPLTALEAITSELKDAGIFLTFQGETESPGSSSPRHNADLLTCLNDLLHIIDTGRAGKVHGAHTIERVVRRLNDTLHQLYNLEASYWFNATMVKHYVRDTILSHATLNGYIDPRRTTDVLGAMLHFIQDAETNLDLMYCIPLLCHQSQQPGERYSTAKDLALELSLRRLTPSRWPDIALRYQNKQEHEAAPAGTTSDTSLLIRHPYIRLARSTEFIHYLLRPFLQDFGTAAPQFERWLKNSLFAIDPGDNIAAKALDAALGRALADLDSGELRMSTFTSTEKYQQTYNETLDALAGSAIEALWAPFDMAASRPDYVLDSFELREALVHFLLAGTAQEDSDWPEDHILLSRLDEALLAIRTLETDAPMELAEIEALFGQIAASYEALYHRANSIVIDVPGITIWYLTSLAIVGNTNSLSPRNVMAATSSSTLYLPINAIAIRRRLTPENQSLLSRALAYLQEQP